MTTRHYKARGFTLLEVLIALIVLSIGLLGVFNLIINSLKANDSSNMRTQAAILANSILDNVRANTNGYTNYSAVIGTTATSPGSTTCLTYTGSGCTPAQIATVDMYNWKQNLLTMLPSGDGSISINTSTKPYTATIMVQWDDTRGTNAFSSTACTSSSSGGTSCTQSLTLVSLLL